MAKLPWRRKLFTVFLVIRQDKVCFDTCPIQLFFIMIVDVGTILFQLKSTVIAWTWSLGGYEFGLEIESVLGKFEKTIYNDI